MANKNQNGYELDVKLKVNSIQSIKPRESGSFKNNDGETIEYGNAVKFKTISVVEEKDEKWGTKEVEKVLEVEVPCNTLTEAVNVNTHLFKMKASDKSFDIGITLPRSNGNELSAKSVLHGIEFINSHKL